MARWRVVDQLRQRPLVAPPSASRKDEPSQTSTLHRIPDPASLELDRIWDEQWALQLLLAAETKVKREVDPRKFQMFDLYAKKGWSPQRVAEAFGVNVDQVYLAKSRIQDMIAQEGRRLLATFG